jgi:hypothetical protein
VKEIASLSKKFTSETKELNALLDKETQSRTRQHVLLKFLPNWRLYQINEREETGTRDVSFILSDSSFVKQLESLVQSLMNENNELKEKLIRFCNESGLAKQMEAVRAERSLGTFHFLSNHWISCRDENTDGREWKIDRRTAKGKRGACCWNENEGLGSDSAESEGNIWTSPQHLMPKKMEQAVRSKTKERVAHMKVLQQLEALQAQQLKDK